MVLFFIKNNYEIYSYFFLVFMLVFFKKCVYSGIIFRCCFDDVVYTENYFCCFSRIQENLSFYLEVFCDFQFCYVFNGIFFYIWKDKVFIVEIIRVLIIKLIKNF